MTIELWLLIGAVLMIGVLVAIILDPTTKRRDDDDDLPPGTA